MVSSSSAFDDDDDDDDDDVSLLLSKSVSSSSPSLFFFESATKRILFRRPRFLRPRSKRVVARVERRTLRFEKVEEDDDDENHGAERTAPPPTRTVKEDVVMFSREHYYYSLSSVYRQSFSDDRCRGLSLCLLSKRAFRDSIQVRREEDGLFPKDTMLRTRTKSNTNDDTIRGGESGSALRGSKGKHHSQRKKKHILNLCIGFAIVFILGAFFSLFVYDIEDLEEASAVSFRDDGKGTLDDESRKKKRRRNHEEEKETEEAHSTRRRGSQVGSAVTPNARFDVRSSFAQSFAALSKGGNGGSFPYRYVFDLLLFARLCRVFQ